MIEYLPFGKINIITHWKDQTPDEIAWFHFTGQRLDDEVGLMYYGARYYDPDIGRFITPDTFVQAPENPQSFNRYTYVINNPVNLVDPTGHFFGFIAAIFKAVTAIAAKVSIASVVKGAVVGSLVGGAVSVAVGGNIGQGFLTGAIGGSIFGGIGGFDLAGAKQVFAHLGGGLASGAISSVATGMDPVKGALIGGVSAGVAQWIGTSGPQFLKTVKATTWNTLSGNVVRRAVIGATLGGAASSALGGRFAEGAQNGAVSGAIGYLANDNAHPEPGEKSLSRAIWKNAADLLGDFGISSVAADLTTKGATTLGKKLTVAAKVVVVVKDVYDTVSNRNISFEGKVRAIRSEVVGAGVSLGASGVTSVLATPLCGPACGVLLGTGAGTVVDYINNHKVNAIKNQYRN